MNKRFWDYIRLHVCILYYSLATLLSKLASGYQFLSLRYVCCMSGVFLIMGTYAVLWQQIIKKFDPSVAYSNKSVTTLWVLLYSAILFGEALELKNIIGGIIIISGIVMISQKDE